MGSADTNVWRQKCLEESAEEPAATAVNYLKVESIALYKCRFSKFISIIITITVLLTALSIHFSCILFHQLMHYIVSRDSFIESCSLKLIINLLLMQRTFEHITRIVIYQPPLSDSMFLHNYNPNNVTHVWY